MIIEESIQCSLKIRNLLKNKTRKQYIISSTELYSYNISYINFREILLGARHFAILYGVWIVSWFRRYDKANHHLSFSPLRSTKRSLPIWRRVLTVPSWQLPKLINLLDFLGRRFSFRAVNSSEFPAAFAGWLWLQDTRESSVNLIVLLIERSFFDTR